MKPNFFNHSWIFELSSTAVSFNSLSCDTLKLWGWKAKNWWVHFFIIGFSVFWQYLSYFPRKPKVFLSKWSRKRALQNLILKNRIWIPCIFVVDTPWQYSLIFILIAQNITSYHALTHESALKIQGCWNWPDHKIFCLPLRLISRY